MQVVLGPRTDTLGAPGSYGPDRITKTIWDAAGQARQEIRAFGTSAQQVYATHKFEPDGQEIAIADSDAGIQIGVSYADALNATSAVAHQTNYAYDGFDRLVTTTYADNTTDQVSSYDSNGNVLAHTNRAGQSIAFTFDKIDRMATKAVPAAGAIPANTLSWTYDLINEVTGLSDTNGNVLANTYDMAGHQLTASQTLPGMTGGARTVAYTYDNGAGDKVDRSKIAWPDGYFVSYGYDGAGHMSSATDSDGTALATRTYDNLGRPATQQYPFANDNIAWSWTAEDDMLTLVNNLGGGAANDVTYTNTFTPAHQWNSSTISNAAYKYVVSNTGSDSYAAPNGLNQYTWMTPAGGSTPPANGTDCTGHAEAISYDCNGNLTGDGTLALTYDPENRLMKASKTGMTASYLYDPLGRRTTKTVSGTVTNFLHDGATEIGEYDATGNIQRRFVPGSAIDQPIAMLTCTGSGNSCAGTNATKTMFHVDKLGSVVAMSSANNGQLATNGGPFLYDAYGNCVSGGAPCSTAGTPYLYTGQRFDPETGLYFYRARYYSPSLGRFVQTDAVGYGPDVNWYDYVDDDPTDKTDPSGNCVEDACVVEGGIGAGVVYGVAAGLVAIGVCVQTCGAIMHDIEKTARHILHNDQGPKPAAENGESKPDSQAPGSRAGKPFTPKGKQIVKDGNKASNGGKQTCQECERETKPAEQGQKGVKPPNDETHVDHIIPKSQGGSGTPENGQVLCRECNLAKGDKLPENYKIPEN